MFIGYLLYLLVIVPKYLSPLRHVPGPEWKPIIGNFLQMAARPGAEQDIEWARKYGQNGHIRTVGLFGRETIHFLRPKALRKILVEEPYSYLKPCVTAKLLGLVAGYGLLTVEGDTHKKMRKPMNPTFSLINLIEQFPVYYDKIYPLVEVMNKHIDESEMGASAIIVCDAWCSRALLDIISLTAFGYEIDSVHNPDNELAHAYHTVTSLQNGRNQAALIALLQLPFAATVLDKLSDISSWKSFVDGIAPQSRVRDLFLLLNGMHRIKNVSKEILHMQLASGDRAATKPGFKTIIDIIEEHYLNENDGKARNMRQAEKDMVTQDKLRKEYKELMNSDPRPSYSAIKGLTYLDAVINEVMRLTPPVPRTLRQAQKSDTIDGIYIPKGTLLPIGNRAINTEPSVWGDDAMEFKPERWFNLPENYDKTFSMMTFIAGAHRCIGRTMSYLEMKATVCILIANFKFEPISKDQNPRMDALITVKPKGGLPLKVSKA